MAKGDYKVSWLVDQVEQGLLQLPEMQREYVWKATRVRDLLDSLYRGYPSGVILAWEADEQVATREFSVETSNHPPSRPLLLLDGQQRITSLSSVLRGEPVHVRGLRKPVEILFNLEHPDELNFVTDVLEDSDDLEEETDEINDLSLQDRFKQMTFVVGNKALEALPSWVSVTDIFKKSDSEILREAGVSNFEDPRFEKYSSRIKAVRYIANYEYRMEVLGREKSYEEVTEIFVRVNSLGAKLKSSDLALAQITAKWRGSLELFRKYQDEIDASGFNFDLGTYLRAMVAIITGQSKFISVRSLSVKELEIGWKDTQKAFNYSLNFLKANLGIDSLTLLSSPYLVITTAFWIHKNQYKVSETDSATFRKWFLLANAKGRYSRGSSQSLLDQDLNTIKSGAKIEELISRLEQQIGRLEFTSEEIVGRSTRSGAFKTLFLVLKQEKARDWATNLEISAKHLGKSDSIEYHHIFPKAYLKKHRPELDSSMVDDLANLAFIGSETNKKISDKAPIDYKSSFAKENLQAQLIDFENGLDDPKNFEKFIDARRATIAQKLNEFLQVE